MRSLNAAFVVEAGPFAFCSQVESPDVRMNTVQQIDRAGHRFQGTVNRSNPDEADEREEMLACLAQALGGLEIDRDELADALLGHGHTKEPVHARHGDGVVRDDHKAGIR